MSKPKWAPGMLTKCGHRVIEVVDTGVHIPYHGRGNAFLGWREIEMDMEDPATVGCLLAQVRETWGVCVITLDNDGSGIIEPLFGDQFPFDNLIAALEAA